MKNYKRFKSLILGKSLSDDRLKNEKLTRFWGLPIMASDAVSSVAYAVEEMLVALLPALGLLSTGYIGVMSIPIILLLVTLVFSYSQIINSYPKGGGSYVVCGENLGKKASLLAAACLVVDYILTVTVSVSASASAVVALFPDLMPHKILISLMCVAIITIVNLRGIGESSKIFGVPTYAFIFTMVTLIITGFIGFFNGNIKAITYPSHMFPKETLQSVSIVLLLRAFASGCSALTGIEAVSDAVPEFKEPSQRTAKHVLYMLSVVIVFVFGGASFLEASLKIVPHEGTTVLAEMGKAVFGNGMMFYFLQLTTALILLLAANTAYSGLPILLSILAKDKLMPRQFTQRGTKLSFSNGITFISIVSTFLLIGFSANTHKLIPFYSVGVFVSFTISQFGMLIKWVKQKPNGWLYKAFINGFGGIITLVGTIVVFTTKFSQGSWVLLVIIPLLMIFMYYTDKHYTKFMESISIKSVDYKYKKSASKDTFPCVVLINNLNKATIKTFEYAKSITSNVIPLHISTSEEKTKQLEEEWEIFKIEDKLTIINNSYRDILDPIDEFLTKKTKELKHGQNLTVVLTKISGSGWENILFHNQTTFLIKKQMESQEEIAIIMVPYFYGKKKKISNIEKTGRNKI